MRDYWECFFDVYADVTDQVYQGNRDHYPASDMAVRETSGLVICDSAHMPVKAYYHSTCGGVTASCSQVWPYRKCFSYLESVDDDTACSASRLYTWTYSWSRRELDRIIQSSLRKVVGGSGPVGSLKDVSIEEQTPEGRVAILKVHTTGGDYKIQGDRCRWVLRRKGGKGPILWSAFFNLERKGSQYVALGRGYGHGVGLCQMGALGRALRGESYVQILRTYFRNIRIVPVSSLKQ
jgi:stage II sporulation protein D